MLNLAEELLLLALEDESGKVSSSASGSLDCGVAGAAVMELVLRGKLGMEDGKLVVEDGTSTGDTQLDALLSQIRDSRKPRGAEHWVGVFSGQSLREGLVKRLVEKGILHEEEGRILWIFPSRSYPIGDAAPERELRNRIRAVALEGKPPEPKDAALLILIKACDLTGEVFAPEEEARVRESLDRISEDELIGEAVSGALAQAQAAMNAAVMASVLSASATSAAACSSSSAPSCG